MTAQDYKTPESVSRLQQRALIAGIIGVVVCIIGYIKSPESLLQSYLMAFMLILGLSLGSLGLLMMHHLTSGYWGIVIRRPLESATRALPLVFILFAPHLFRLPPYLWRMAQRPGQRRRRPLRIPAALLDRQLVPHSRDRLLCGVAVADVGVQRLVAPSRP